MTGAPQRLEPTFLHALATGSLWGSSVSCAIVFAHEVWTGDASSGPWVGLSLALCVCFAWVFTVKPREFVDG